MKPNKRFISDQLFIKQKHLLKQLRNIRRGRCLEIIVFFLGVLKNLMKKNYRIKKNDEFQKVFKSGTSFANRQLVIYFLTKEEQPHFRIGLSVSKRIGIAVLRNQIKRYLRQAFHELDGQIKNNYDFVIIARQPTKDMDFKQLKKSLVHVLSKSNLMMK